MDYFTDITHLETLLLSIHYSIKRPTLSFDLVIISCLKKLSKLDMQWDIMKSSIPERAEVHLTL